MNIPHPTRALAALFSAGLLCSPALADELPERPDVWIKVKDIKQVSISPDGKFVGALFYSGDAKLYSRTDGKEVRRIEKPGLLVFTPDSKHVLTATSRKPKGEKERLVVTVEEVATGEAARTFDLRPWHGLRGLFAVGGKVLVVLGADGRPAAYDYGSGELLGEFDCKEHAPWRLALSRDGGTLVTAGRRWDLCVWDVRKRELLRELRRFDWPIHTVAVSADGRWCACVSKGRDALRAWVFDRDSGKLMADAPLTTSAESLHFSPDGETLVAVGDGLNNGVALWDWRRGGQVRGGIPKGLLEGKISDERPEDVAKYKILSLAEGSLADDGTLLTREAKGVLRLFDLGLKPKKDGPKKDGQKKED